MASVIPSWIFQPGTTWRFSRQYLRWIRTLDLRINSQVLYHCANTAALDLSFSRYKLDQRCLYTNKTDWMLWRQIFCCFVILIQKAEFATNLLLQIFWAGPKSSEVVHDKLVRLSMTEIFSGKGAAHPGVAPYGVSPFGYIPFPTLQY